MKRSNVIRTPSNAELEKLFEPYGVELGKLVYAWNLLQGSLCEVFSILAPPARVAEAVWHSTQNDRTQREMLRSAAKAIHGTRHVANLPKMQEDVVWLVNRANSLADQRNDAIHAPLSFTITPEEIRLEPPIVGGNPRAAKLKGKDLLNEFRLCRERADVLTCFARNLSYAIQRGPRQPWPKRPSLPNPEQKRTRPGPPRPPRTK